MCTGRDSTGMLTTHLWPCVFMGDGETVPQVMIGSLGRLVFWRDIPEVSWSTVAAFFRQHRSLKYYDIESIILMIHDDTILYVFLIFIIEIRHNRCTPRCLSMLSDQKSWTTISISGGSTLHRRVGLEHFPLAAMSVDGGVFLAWFGTSELVVRILLPKSEPFRKVFVSWNLEWILLQGGSGRW